MARRFFSITFPGRFSTPDEAISAMLNDARPNPDGKPHVVIYTRRGCHLCDEAQREILSTRDACDFTLQEIDIDADPALVRRYGMDIPVVLIDGIVMFKYRLTAQDFKLALRQSARARK